MPFLAVSSKKHHVLHPALSDHLLRGTRTKHVFKSLLVFETLRTNLLTSDFPSSLGINPNSTVCGWCESIGLGVPPGQPGSDAAHDLHFPISHFRRCRMGYVGETDAVRWAQPHMWHKQWLCFARGHAVWHGDVEPGSQLSTASFYLHIDTSPGTCLTALLKWAVKGP